MLEAVRALVAQRLGLDLRRRRGAELERKLLRACRAAGESDPLRYLDALARAPEHGPEWQALVDEVAVGETSFFRDRDCFAALERHVLPELVERRRRSSRTLRIWSAGCATGEEPYSLAMLLADHLPDRRDWSITVLGTDVSARALAAARRAAYREWSFRDTPWTVRQRYFRPAGRGTLALAEEIRRLVTFAPLNLAGAEYPSPATNTTAMDLILCRNVIMYFTPDAQRRAAARLRDALAPGGWLIVGAAEGSSDLTRPLEPITYPGAVFFRKVERRQPVTPRRTASVPRRAGPSPQAAPRRRPAERRPVAERRAAEAPASLLAWARAEADRGNLDRARSLCRQATATDRLDPGAHLLLAAIEQERGDLVAAAKAARSAIYLAPGSPSAHFLHGSVLFRLGRTAQARSSMRTVVTLLRAHPPDELVDEALGLPAGRLLEAAAARLGER